MENRALARRYAKVLSQIDPGGELEYDVQQLSASIHQSRHVLMVFLDPMVLGKIKLEAIMKAYGPMPEKLRTFLEFVNRKNRLDHLPLILVMYLQAHHHNNGIVHGMVRSATALNEAQVLQLETTMGAHLGKKCILGTTIDSRLIGGFSIHIEDSVYDNSVRGQLDRLRTHLTTLVG